MRDFLQAIGTQRKRLALVPLVERVDEARALGEAGVAAFAMHGASVVKAGRPPCPLCGQPLDPEGHVCARLNGHRPQT